MSKSKTLRKSKSTERLDFLSLSKSKTWFLWARPIWTFGREENTTRHVVWLNLFTSRRHHVMSFSHVASCSRNLW